MKSSEDNLVEGVKFHLFGTSLSGAAVDQYAVTDKNGVATLRNTINMLAASTSIVACYNYTGTPYVKEFDVVLNMADGAIGYLEDDGENHKIFSVIAKALKNGGKHFMDIMNGSYAQTHFPCKLWDVGEKGLTLSAFEWEKDRKTLIYGQVDYMYGEALYKPEMKEGNPIRLYSLDEITEIFCKLGLRICNSFADFSGKPSSNNDIQLIVYSIRE